MKQALVLRGGWTRHFPVEAAELFLPFLEEHGYAVRIEENPEIYADREIMAGPDVVVQCVSMSTITREQAWVAVTRSSSRKPGTPGARDPRGALGAAPRSWIDRERCTGAVGAMTMELSLTT